MITRARSAGNLGSELVQMVKLLDQYDGLVTELLSRPSLPVGADLENGLPLRDFIRGIEREIVLQYLIAAKWNVSKTATLLKVSRVNLLDRIRKYQIQRPRES